MEQQLRVLSEENEQFKKENTTLKRQLSFNGCISHIIHEDFEEKEEEKRKECEKEREREKSFTGVKLCLDSTESKIPWFRTKDIDTHEAL